MSLLAVRKKTSALKKRSLSWLLFSVFCAAFGMIYEYFGHGVYSPFMLFAFLIPLIGGFFVNGLLALISKTFMPGKAPANMYFSGLLTLTVGSLFKGALDIYGTTSSFTPIYFFVGLFFICAACLLYLAGLLSARAV